MHTLTVTLTPELMTLVADRVREGGYVDESDFVRDAIRQLDRNHSTAHEAKLDRLRKRLRKGTEQAYAGDVVTITREQLMAGLES